MGLLFPWCCARSQSGENDLGTLNEGGHSQHGGYLLRGSSHGQKSLPCASCPGTSTAPSQNCRAVDGLAGLQPMMVLQPGCLCGWETVSIPIQEPPWADGEMLAGLLRTHLEPGEEWSLRENIWDIHSWAQLRCKKTIDVGSSLQVWATHVPFVLSEWNRKQQNKVGWPKRWGSKYMF